MNSLYQKVIEYIDRQKTDLVDFLSKLIGFPSVNPGMPGQGKELELQQWLSEKLRQFGFDEVDCWSADSKIERPNIVATIKGSGGGKSLILNGHCDVVPVNEKELEKWDTDPWSATIKNGRLFGRGASDMKGGLTAMIWAAKAIIDNEIDLKGDLFVESVVGEESGEGETVGTNSTLQRGYKAPFAIIGEPTSCEIKVRTPGVFFFELEIQGKETHICNRNQVIFPQKHGVSSGSKIGVDAITSSIQFMQLFQKIELQWNQRWQDELLPEEEGVGSFTIGPCFIEGGTYGAAVVPGSCRIVYNVRYPWWLKDEDLWQELKRYVDALASTDDWFRKNPPKFKVPVIRRWQPMIETPVDHPGARTLAAAFEKLTGNKARFSSFKGLTDATFLTRGGVPTVLFGPGSHDCGIHGPNEYISIDELILCAKIYAVMILDWCR